MRTPQDNDRRNHAPLLRWGLHLVGCTSVVLAVLGLFLPVLPTVPFLLLALACFSRSSSRFYAWLIRHEQLGPLVRLYLDGNGIPFKAKLKAIALIWVSILISTIFLLDILWVRIVLPVIALGVTFYLLRLPVGEETTPE
ncbi:YbaN family protein [Trichloromonas sp.]|uniref:YbaN family protein n=1 Tax=Trichloromonas sp. TaxID=3069249 RepID=UPI003D8148CC